MIIGCFCIHEGHPALFGIGYRIDGGKVPGRIKRTLNIDLCCGYVGVIKGGVYPAVGIKYLKMGKGILGK